MTTSDSEAPDANIFCENNVEAGRTCEEPLKFIPPELQEVAEDLKKKRKPSKQIRTVVVVKGKPYRIIISKTNVVRILPKRY